MMTRRRMLTCGGLVLGPLFSLVTPEESGASEHRLVVVVQKASPLAELSLRQLKRLYLGEQVNDPNGDKLMPLNHPPAVTARVGFDRLVLEMDPDEIGRFWVDRKIRGQPGAPRAVPSIDLLRKVIASMPGAVTYLDVNDVTADLKVVNVEGKGVKDPDYPLRF